MSSLVVPVAVITNLRKHPNADTLDICDVLGWQVCVKRGEYVENQPVVYFPPDTMIPTEWSEKWGVTKYLKKDGRVGKIKLRGEPSFGLALNLTGNPNWVIGQNVADYYGCTKYEPPVRVGFGDAEVPHICFDTYTDIENLRNYPDVFVPGEEVIVTEKIHGTNSRVGLVCNDFPPMLEVAGSKGMRRKRPSDENMKSNLYWSPLAMKQVQALLHDVKEMYFEVNNIILFGEIYGPSVQNLHYGMEKSKPGYRAFDLMIDSKYSNYEEFKRLCDKHGIPTVPLVYRGPFDIKKIRELSEGNTLMGVENHIREGVVVKPVHERTDPKVGRVIMKYVGDTYLFGSNSDFKEE